MYQNSLISQNAQKNLLMGDTVKTVNNNFLNNSIVQAMLLFILLCNNDIGSKPTKS